MSVLGKTEKDFNIIIIFGHFFHNLSEIENTIKKTNKNVELVYNTSRKVKLTANTNILSSFNYCC